MVGEMRVGVAHQIKCELGFAESGAGFINNPIWEGKTGERRECVGWGDLKFSNFMR